MTWGALARQLADAVYVVRVATLLQWRTAPVPSAAALIFTVCGGLLTAATAWLTKLLLDELGRGSGADDERALGLAVAVAALGGSAVVLVHLTDLLNAVLRRRIKLAVEGSLYARVIALQGLRHFEDPVFHGRLRLAGEAAQQAPHSVAELVHAVVRSTVTLVTLAGVVLVVSPSMVGLLLLVGAIGLAAQLVRSQRDAVAEQALVQNHRWSEFYRSLLVDLRAAKETRLFELGELFRGRMLDALDRATHAELRLVRAGALLQIAFALLCAAVTATGAFLVVKGALRGEHAIGDVSLFLAAVVGIGDAFRHLVMQVSVSGPNLLLFRAYLDLLALPLPPPAPFAALAPLSRGIELRDVWFRYGPDHPWVLRGVSLSIPAGASVGLVGLNGAGKSTLVKLLCRFYEAERGEILWDGVDIRQVEPVALRRRMAVTFQDFVTYDLSAAENIGLGETSGLFDRDRIRAAAARAGLDETLCALPDGYDTMLSRILASEARPDAVGVTLSGGQWQRVALARCLMRHDVDFMILDEPSSGLDALAEAEMHHALGLHAAGRTRLLVSHRLGTLRDADLIAVLSEGRIVVQGTHAQLMAGGGDYARMFRLQARGYEDPTPTRADLVGAA